MTFLKCRTIQSADVSSRVLNSDDSAQEPKYDLFLSHASEDKDWCEKLAERLRNEGVRVWFDGWQIKPGHHLEAKLNEGLEKSRKLVAVWTPNYFREGKVWTLAEGFAKQHSDVLAQDRPIIPLLKADCEIPLFTKPHYRIDFRNPDDFELSFRALIDALDLPKPGQLSQESMEFLEHRLGPGTARNIAYTQREGV